MRAGEFAVELGQSWQGRNDDRGLDNHYVIVILHGMDKKGVVKLIKDRVQRAGSQAALADELGVSQAYINSVLSGKREPGPSMLEGLGIRKTVKYEFEDSSSE